MASKQVKRCRTSLVIKKRLIEIRDIILLVGAGERGWKCGCAQAQALSRLTPWLAPVRRIVGAFFIPENTQHTSLLTVSLNRATTVAFMSLVCPGHSC